MMNLTAKELRDKITAGEITSAEATKLAFERIDKLEPVIGAYISTFHQPAMERAAEVDRRITAGRPVGELAGVPVAIKDNMCTTFGATTCASKILESFRAPFNATVGAILLYVGL